MPPTQSNGQDLYVAPPTPLGGKAKLGRTGLFLVSGLCMIGFEPTPSVKSKQFFNSLVSNP